MNGASALSWADERDLKVGHIVGPFELLALVGRGGMARVWAARERQTGGFYALKMLRSHLAEDQTFREMFFDEARIASLCQHENIAHTYELLELDGILCLIMELVEGPSLVRIVRPGSGERDDAPRVPLPPRLAARIVADACAGLHAAHEQRDEQGHPLAVVHRDVSPQNVLVSMDGHVKVTDFGVAKALNKINVTLAGQIKGKLAYMSPEQLTGGGGIDRRSDVFALGSLLYELSVGTRAFDGESDPEVMRAILTGDPAPPSRRVPGYPPALEHIVMRAIASDVAHRFQTAEQMEEALDGYIANSGPPVGLAEVAMLVHERTGVPASSLAPIPAPRSSSPALPSSSPNLKAAQSQRSSMPMASGTRRREEPARTSLLTLFSAVTTGLLLGLVVLWSVYYARKTHAVHPGEGKLETTTVPSTAVTAPSPKLKIPAARAAPGEASNEPAMELPPTIAPRTSAPRPGGHEKTVAPALPPNPYE